MPSSYVLFVVLTVLGNVLAVGGAFSLRRLLRLPFAQGLKPRDPFSRTIAILFTQDADDADFRRCQRQTIWLFCGAMLVLYLARWLLARAQA